MHEDEPADQRVERAVRLIVEDVGLFEPHPTMSGAIGSRPRPRQKQRTSGIVDADDLAFRPDHPGRRHGDVTAAAADIEHAHARTDAGAPEDVVGFLAEDFGLLLKPCQLAVGVTENVPRLARFIEIQHARHCNLRSSSSVSEGTYGGSDNGAPTGKQPDWKIIPCLSRRFVNTPATSQVGRVCRPILSIDKGIGHINIGDNATLAGDTTMSSSDRTVTTSHADIAVSETAGSGVPIVMIHGNSSNRRVFARQMDGAVGDGHRVIALDLPGHGESSDAQEPDRTYTMAGYAEAVIETLAAMDVDRAAVFGWSLGGHIGLELIARFPGMIGLMITGTTPVGRAPEEIQSGFQPSPHIGLAGKADFSAEEAGIFAFATYGDPQSAEAHQAIARTDGRARAVMFASLFAGQASDQRKIAETSPVPLAVVNGEHDPLVDLDYIGSLAYANLWEEHCFVLRGAGHAPFMQVPDVFNPTFERFAADMNMRAGTVRHMASSSVTAA